VSLSFAGRWACGAVMTLGWWTFWVEDKEEEEEEEEPCLKGDVERWEEREAGAKKRKRGPTKSALPKYTHSSTLA
jgi:hypothetical protein